MKRLPLFPFFPRLLLLLLPLAALADEPRQPYACDNGSHLEISFSTPDDGPPQAILHFADSNLTLPQVPTASGTLYRQDDIRLHRADDQALFEDGKGNTRRCRRGEQPPAAAANPAAASSFIDLSGNVSFPDSRPLPARAVLLVRVIKTSGRSPLTLAEQRIELAGQVSPIAFHTTIDRDLLGKKPRVQVSARIDNGKQRLFVSENVYPALDDGQPGAIDIPLKQVGRAARR